ncbi:MAG: InlB B-repeat-containing protein [Firmicutes bacterium]|nr:InlB B-repeat-containing protein [Bacillota bacterium]
MSNPAAPAFLHIPDLYAGAAARISCDLVDNASGYILERQFHGKEAGEHTWTTLEMQDRTWAELDHKPLTWHQIDEHPKTWWQLDHCLLHPSAIDHIATGAQTAVYRVKAYTADGSESAFLTSRPMKINHIISYNANGGTDAPAAQTKATGAALTLTHHIPTRTGHIFLGWATASDATVPVYSPGGIFTANANTTLYAVWQFTFYRQDRTQWPVTKGTRYWVPIAGKNLGDTDQVPLTVEYNADKLRLENFIAHLPGQQATKPGSYPAANLQIDGFFPGEVRFKCTRQIPAGEHWHGYVTLLQFIATETGIAELSLSQTPTRPSSKHYVDPDQPAAK